MLGCPGSVAADVAGDPVDGPDSVVEGEGCSVYAGREDGLVVALGSRADGDMNGWPFAGGALEIFG